MSDTYPSCAGLVIPSWGLDRRLYDRICNYLQFTASPELYGKVCRYLLSIAAEHPEPTGFARHLSELRPGRIGLEVLDVWTRLLMPTNPWRYRFNAVVAVHECDPRGYSEMMTGAGTGFRAWRVALAAVLSYGVVLVVGVPWLCWQGGLYLLSKSDYRQEERLFPGATVVVTGASRGLGLALCARLLSLGANVVALARESQALLALEEAAADAGFGTRLRIVAADVADAEAVQRTIAAAGVEPSSVDAVIINAGIKTEASKDAAPEVLRQTFAVNVFGAMNTADAFLPAFRARGDGRLVFISSVGRWHGMARTGAYNASKAALSVLAESMAIDLRAEGQTSVKIAIVEPGLIRTDMLGDNLLQRILSVDVTEAARRIVRSLAKGQVSCRFPFAFVLLTAAVAILPVGLRIRILGKVKETAHRQAAGARK